MSNLLDHDIGFNYPKKILKPICVGLIIVFLVVGIVTRDSQKASDAYFWCVNLVFKPVINKMVNRTYKTVEISKELGSPG